jgi:hypothetical protein
MMSVKGCLCIFEGNRCLDSVIETIGIVYNLKGVQ